MEDGGELLYQRGVPVDVLFFLLFFLFLPGLRGQTVGLAGGRLGGSRGRLFGSRGRLFGGILGGYPKRSEHNYGSEQEQKYESKNSAR